MPLVDKIERKIVKINFLCYILLYLNFYFCTNFCDAKSLTAPSKEVYMLRYTAGEKNISMAVEIDLKNQTELLIRLRRNNRQDPVTFYDFSQRKVAYKDLNNKQCFVGDIVQETLEGDRRRLAQLKNGTVKGVSIPINLTIHREIKNQSEVLEIFGNRINSFCNGSSVFDVTSDVKLSRTRRDTTNSRNTNGNRHFSHHSYGISRKGAVDKGSMARDDQRRQHQVRKAGFQFYPSEVSRKNTQDPPSNGPIRKKNIPPTNVPLKNYQPKRNIGVTGSRQFSPQIAQESGYQMDYPFGGLSVGLPKPKLQAGIGLGKAPGATAQVGLPSVGLGGAASAPGGLPLGVPDTQLQAGIDLGKAPAATAQVGLPSFGLGGAASVPGGLPLVVPDTQLQAGIDLGKTPAATAQVGLPSIGLGGATSVPGVPLVVPDTPLQAGIDLGKAPAATAQVGLPSVGLGSAAFVAGGQPLVRPGTQLQAGIDLGKTTAAEAQGGLVSTGENRTQLSVPDGANSSYIPSRQQIRVLTPEIQPPQHLSSSSVQPQSHVANQINLILQSNIPPNTQNIHLSPDVRQPGYHSSNTDTQPRVQIGYPSFVAEIPSMPVFRPELQQPEHQQRHIPAQIPSQVPLSFSEQHAALEVPTSTGFQPGHYEQPSTYFSPPRPNSFQEDPKSRDLRLNPGYYQQPSSHVSLPKPDQSPEVQKSPNVGIQPGQYQRPATHISPPKLDRPSISVFILPPGHQRSSINTQSRVSPPTPDRFQEVTNSPYYRFQPGHYQQSSTHVSPSRIAHPQEVPKPSDLRFQPEPHQQSSSHISQSRTDHSREVPKPPDLRFQPGHYQQISTHVSQSRTDHSREVPKPSDLRFQPGHYQQISTNVSPSRTDHPQEVPKPSHLRFQPGHYQQISTHVLPPRPDHPQQIPNSPDLRYQPGHYQHRATHRPSTSVDSRTSKPGNSGQQRQGPREPDQGCCCKGRRKKKRRGGRRKQKAVLYALVPVNM